MDENRLATLRHSTAHVMAHAVTKLFPGTKVAIGPSIDEGFYYDFDVSRPFTPEDLDAISAQMKKIIKERKRFKRIEVSRAQALEMFKDEPYKLELINDLPEDEVISIYEEGDFIDLCRGPHIESTKDIKAYKLMSIAGAYWRGDEKRPMLQRIYGTAFETQEELDEHLEKIAEAERRDHRKIGKELDLFSLQEEAGPGLVFWHPKGALVRKFIEDYWRNEHLANGYDLLFSPHIAKEDLWHTSGHLDFYSDSMYSGMEIDNQNYLIKPMNCPFHILMYKSKLRSYRDLPMRWAELGTVYRYERAGVLHGLMRVRGFTQDDAHLFFAEEDINAEVVRVVEFVIKTLKRFGFEDYQIYLSTKPEKSVGSDEIWERATSALKASLESLNLDFDVDEGGGAFYGPKIDVKIKDAIGRYWQCSTIQLDFNLPERFDMTYIGNDNKQHRPIMIHRTLLGSMERFFGVLIEHYMGAFPLWLAPVQAIILPIADRHIDFSKSVAEKLQKEGFRVHIDDRSEKTGFKIREAQMQKIPYMLVVGDKEIESGAVSVRSRSEGDKGAIAIDELIEVFRKEL